MEKNCLLQFENVVLCIFNSDLSGCCVELQVCVIEVVVIVIEQRELIVCLEQDLSIIQFIQWFDVEGVVEYCLEKILEFIKEVIVLFYGFVVLVSGVFLEGQVDLLFFIIFSQRECFCVWNQEFEVENCLVQYIFQVLQSELDSLCVDNIKFFEKIKFLQSYFGWGSSSDDMELWYLFQYEECLDFFFFFSKWEWQRKYLSLSFWDKVIFSMGCLVFFNKMVCIISFFYILFLYCLVFLVFYKLVWSESVERDCVIFCVKKFVDYLYKFYENDNGVVVGDLWQ